ncbi:hypothetical protein [Thiorhodococcus fuscus]|uniref:Uncharacterized protein n=1 Tax=Thiorhodococcus fuscus TaxID=527200 RepID=A0ABW4Y8B1_9GAMM
MKPKIVKPGWEEDYFFGDFWYIFEPSDGTFHLFIQCMEKGSRWVGKYPEVSRMAYAVTRDFKTINYIAYDLIETPDVPYSSIWNSCTVYRDSKQDFLTFYTERSTRDVKKNNDGGGETRSYWANQNIKIAKSTGLLDWSVVLPQPYTSDFDDYDKNINISLTNLAVGQGGSEKADKYFQRYPDQHSCTVHAWRDPHVFHAARGDKKNNSKDEGGEDKSKKKDKYYMLVAAKKLGPYHQDNVEKRQDATIALLEAEDDNLEKWHLATYDKGTEPIMLSPTNGAYVGGENLGGHELEVPQIYRDVTNNEIVVLASTAHPEDYKQSYYRGYNPWNNLPPSANVRVRGGYLIAMRYKNFDSLFKKKCKPKHEIVAGPTSGLYACRVIPELDGHIVGFDVKNGVPRFREGAQMANLDYLTDEDRRLHMIPELDRTCAAGHGE